jgi:hypothetical protein
MTIDLSNIPSMKDWHACKSCREVWIPGNQEICWRCVTLDAQKIQAKMQGEKVHESRAISLEFKKIPIPIFMN